MKLVKDRGLKPSRGRWKADVPLMGQGSTEYLVILATILVIALGAVVVIMFLNLSTVSAREQQIREYWNNIASPFALIDWSEEMPFGPAIITTYNLTLIIENREDREKDLMMVRIDGADTLIRLVDGSEWAGWPVEFDRGQRRTIALEIGGCRMHQSPGHQHNVSLVYDNFRGLEGNVQHGREPLWFYFDAPADPDCQ